MSKANETTVLVEIKPLTQQPFVGFVEGGEIVRIVRTYLTEKRAQQDLALLQEISPDRRFMLHISEHIDD